MTGIEHIRQFRDGRIAIIYQDQETELAEALGLNIVDKDLSVISICSQVQAQRPNTKRFPNYNTFIETLKEGNNA